MKKLLSFCVFLLPVCLFAQADQAQVKHQLTQKAVYYSPTMQTLLKKATLQVIFATVQPEASFAADTANASSGYRQITRRVCTGLMLNAKGVIALQKECITPDDLKMRGPLHFRIQLTHMRKAPPYYKHPISFEAYFTIQKHPQYDFFLLHPSTPNTDRELQSVINETFLWDTKAGRRMEILPQQAAESLAAAEEPRVLQEVKVPTTIPWFE